MSNLRPVTPPAINAPQRERAIYWRVNVMRLTQEQLASLLNVRRSTIWRFESGEQPMTTMYRMACIGVDTMSRRRSQKWTPDTWPYVGDRKTEEKAFKRYLQYDPEQED